RRCFVLMGAQPVARSHAPAVARNEAREMVGRHRRDEVVADRLLVLEELLRDDRADRVAAEILEPGVAPSVAVEAGQWVGSALLQRLPEDVARAHLSRA